MGTMTKEELLPIRKPRLAAGLSFWSGSHKLADQLRLSIYWPCPHERDETVIGTTFVGKETV